MPSIPPFPIREQDPVRAPRGFDDDPAEIRNVLGGTRFRTSPYDDAKSGSSEPFTEVWISVTVDAPRALKASSAVLA